MVERQLPKLNVAGSIPVSRSTASFDNFHHIFLQRSRILVAPTTPPALIVSSSIFAPMDGGSCIIWTAA